MDWDPSVQVAIVGVLTTIITTSGVVLAAIVNNKRERTGSAGAGIEATLRERILLRDEQLADLRADKAALQARLDECLVEIDEKTTLIKHLRDELAAMKGEA